MQDLTNETTEAASSSSSSSSSSTLVAKLTTCTSSTSTCSSTKLDDDDNDVTLDDHHHPPGNCTTTAAATTVTASSNSENVKQQQQHDDEIIDNHPHIEQQEEERIQVSIRMRPLNAMELKQKHLHARVWKVLPQYSSITQTTRNGDLLQQSVAGRTYFSFDKTFDYNISTQQVYQDTACRDIVTSVVATGRHGTIFAYGQTSSGKTFTMQGLSSSPQSTTNSTTSPTNNNNNNNINDNNNNDNATTTTTIGIVQLASRDIFDYIQNTPQRQFKVMASFLEIYNEEVHDLLTAVSSSSSSSSVSASASSSSDIYANKKNMTLQIREDPQRGVFVQHVHEIHVQTYNELLKIIQIGERVRKVAATDMNERSSRSHTIFRITITSSSSSSSSFCCPTRKSSNHQDDEDDDDDKDSTDDSNHNNHTNDSDEEDDESTTTTTVIDRPVLTATLNLVDLAGSESIRHTGVTGDRAKEGGMINQSLLTLSRVITALGTPNVWHVNFRDSKLTRLLQPSLSGNARMAIICCATPSELYLEETRSTLAFASRAKLVKTRAEVNEILQEGNNNNNTAALIAKLKRELARAQRQLNENYKHYNNLPQADLIKELEIKVQEAQTEAKDAQDRLHRLQASVLNGGILFGRDQRSSAHSNHHHHQHHYEEDTICSSSHASPIHKKDVISSSPQQQHNRAVASHTLLSGSSVGHTLSPRQQGQYHHYKEDTVCSSTARSLVTPVKRENSAASLLSPTISPRQRMAITHMGGKGRSELTILRQAVSAKSTCLNDLRKNLNEISSLVRSKESELLATCAERDGAKDESLLLAAELTSLRAELEKVSLEHQAMTEEKDSAVQDVLRSLERELDERRQLEDTLIAVQEEKTEWDNQKAVFWNKIQSLEDERNEASAWAENLELEAIQTHESCAVQLGEAQHAFEELRQQLETTKTELGSVQRDRDAKRALLDKKRLDPQQQKQQQEAIESLQAALKAKQTELLSMKRERDALINNLKMTKQKLTDERAAKESSRAELLSIKTERDTLSSDLKETKQMLNEEVAKKDASHAELLSIKMELDALSSKLKEMTQSLAYEQAANKDSPFEVLGIRTERDALSYELEKTTRSLNEERAAKEASQAELLSIMTQHDALICQLKETTQTLTDEQATNKASQSELLSIMTERDVLSCELEKMTTSLTMERIAKEASQSEFLSIMTERDALSCKLKQATESLTDRAMEAAKAQETIDSLQSTLDLTLANGIKAKETIDSLQSALEKTQARLLSATSERDHLNVKLEVTTQYLEDERAAVNQMNKTIADLTEITAPVNNPTESSEEQTAVVATSDSGGPPTIPPCYRSMYPLPSTITISQLDLIKNTTTRFLLYGPMAFALEGAGKDDLKAFIELFKRCFKMPDHVPLPCPRGCGRNFVSLPLLLSHMECRNRELGGQCPAEPTLQSTQITPAFVVSVRILPFLKSLWSAIHRKQILGPLDILDPLAIPLPIGEACQHKDDSIVQELALELETLHRYHDGHDDKSNSSSSKKPDMIDWWKQKLKYVKEHRDADTTKAYPHILTMSFLQPPSLWPSDLKRLVEFDG